jgi:hypothetical protein
MHKNAEILAELRSRYPVLTLDELRALPAAAEYDAGVYFLWQGANLQYIGRSDHVLERLAKQGYVNRYAPFQNGASQVAIPHDRHTCLVVQSGMIRSEIARGQCQELERLYIGTYPTPYNNPNFQAFT